MGNQENERLKALERTLKDQYAAPIKLSYAVLQSITNNFSTEIGRGGFGVVYLGTIGKAKVAVKKLHSSTSDLDDKQFAEEIVCLKQAKHKNIVRLLGYCAESDSELVEGPGRYVLADVRRRVLCFEYVPNGSLNHYLREIVDGSDWRICYRIVKGICLGLQHLHQQRINHLDLKPENVLLDAQMEPKITDFGLSRFFQDKQSAIFTKNISGTPGYVPPEMIDNGEISFKSDIYSLGILLQKLLMGHNMHSEENLQQNEASDVDYQPMKKIFEISQECVKDARDDRPNIHTIVEELNNMETMFQHLPRNISELGNEQEPSMYQPTSRELLHVLPRQLCYPLGTEGRMPYSLQLTNLTDNYVAFMFQDFGKVVSLSLFHKGIIFPHSTCGVVLQLEAGVQAAPEDMIVVRSKIVSEDFNRDAISVDWFDKQSCVHDMELDIVRSQLQNNLQRFKESRPLAELTTQGIIKQDCFQKIISIDVHPTEPLILTGHRSHICIWMSDVSTWGDTEAFTLDKSLDYLRMFFTSSRSGFFSLRAITKALLNPEVSVVVINPIDSNTFISVSYPSNDIPGDIKSWNIESTVPKTYVHGGFKDVDYSVSVSDRQYMITVADSTTVQIWDLQTGRCVNTLRHVESGEIINVVVCHPTLPLIFTGTNQGTACIWNLSTCRLVIGLTNGVVHLGFDLQTLL
ncbi:hypothetical protein QOZ80_8AG0622250 [Eleusine coracana subsp. coracana]|nr:hypothetical protein QOZ80_8AG0622250 [Eleusine coracana subsp. coracana]